MYTENQNRLLDIQAVKATTGFKSTTSVYALMRERNFPRPITIGRTNRWIEAEVQAWINQQIMVNRGQS
jgi:predicted DNA-binding transcriptional regulator AlpA